MGAIACVAFAAGVALASTDPAERLILALDRPDGASALALVDVIPDLRWVKVGLELFVASGPAIVRELRDRGLRVFLDLKFHDIPATMRAACRQAAGLGVELLTLHASAGREALRASVAGAAEGAAAAGLPPPTLLAVTVLTSWDPQRFRTELTIAESLGEHALRLASQAAEVGVAGAVCSPLEVACLRRHLPEPFVLVTPGVRPAGSPRGDQARVMTPAEALAAGASRLVVGRPISADPDPAAAFRRCLQGLA